MFMHEFKGTVHVIALNLYFSLSKNDEIKHFLENFRLSWRQPFSKIRLPPPNLTRDGQVGNCLFLTLYNEISKESVHKLEHSL